MPVTGPSFGLAPTPPQQSSTLPAASQQIDLASLFGPAPGPSQAPNDQFSPFNPAAAPGPSPQITNGAVLTQNPGFPGQFQVNPQGQGTENMFSPQFGNESIPATPAAAPSAPEVSGLAPQAPVFGLAQAPSAVGQQGGVAPLPPGLPQLNLPGQGPDQSGAGLDLPAGLPGQQPSAAEAGPQGPASQQDEAPLTPQELQILQALLGAPPSQAGPAGATGPGANPTAAPGASEEQSQNPLGLPQQRTASPAGLGSPAPVFGEVPAAAPVGPEAPTLGQAPVDLGLGGSAGPALQGPATAPVFGEVPAAAPAAGPAPALELGGQAGAPTGPASAPVFGEIPGAAPAPGAPAALPGQGPNPFVQA